MKKILFMFMLVFCLTSCDQMVTRNFGGTTKITLDPGENLWKLLGRKIIYGIW